VIKEFRKVKTTKYSISKEMWNSIIERTPQQYWGMTKKHFDKSSETTSEGNEISKFETPSIVSEKLEK
jgi:hypothetical protein